MKKIIMAVIILIILLVCVLRVYRLSDVPPHLYWDEVSIAYNAFSINQTGKDEWGSSFPLLFKSFGDNKQPLYIYLVTFFQKVLGPIDLSVRLPSAVAGVLTVVAIFYLVREEIFLVKEEYPKLNGKSLFIVPLLTSLFLTISPWHLQFSRPGFEANLALLCQVAGVLFFLVAMRRNINFLLLSAFFFVAAMYSYHSAALTSPLILILLIVLFRKKLFFKWKKVLPAVFLGLILILPYIPNYILSASGRIRFNAESVTHMPGNVIANIVNNYVANFSTDFLFFKGDQNGRHSLKTLGELYVWQLPMVLFGTYFLLKYRSKASYLILGWLLFSALPPALTRVSPHALRDLLAVGSWQTLSAFGALFLFFGSSRLWRYIFIPVFLFPFLLYLHTYFIHYPVVYGPDWQDGQRQAMDYLLNVQDKYDRIFVSKMDLEPIFILWYLKFDPRILQESGHNLEKIGKYEYADMSIIIPKNNQEEKDLMVVPSWMGTNLRVEPLKEIKNFAGKSMFRIYEY